MLQYNDGRRRGSHTETHNNVAASKRDVKVDTEGSGQTSTVTFFDRTSAKFSIFIAHLHQKLTHSESNYLVYCIILKFVIDDGKDQSLVTTSDLALLTNGALTGLFRVILYSLNHQFDFNTSDLFFYGSCISPYL